MIAKTGHVAVVGRRTAPRRQYCSRVLADFARKDGALVIIVSGHPSPPVIQRDVSLEKGATGNMRPMMLGGGLAAPEAGDKME